MALQPAFDDHHPPARELVDDCVHCGFCLPTCPTYLLWGEEMDSPRGRIHLMKQGLEGGPMDVALVQHIDACLGCLACLPACPSGVQYDALVEATRAQVERRWQRSAPDRALRNTIFALFPYRRRLRLLRTPLALYQRSGLARRVDRYGLFARLPAPLSTLAGLLPTLGRAERTPAFTPASGPRRHRVGLLLGCVQAAFFPQVNAATARVLAADGCDVAAPSRQGCCGALSLHVGREDEAAAFARRTIDDFDRAGVETVIVNSAGCASAMKDYGRLLRDDPAYADRATAFSARVRDITEWLVEIGPVAPRRPVHAVVAYHDACHLANAQGIRDQPRRLLADIPGLTLREIAEREICCGSAGVYNLLQPQAAAELGDRKAGHVTATGADVLVTGNPGCLLQVGAALRRSGRAVALAHTVQVLDASIEGTALPR